MYKSKEIENPSESKNSNNTDFFPSEPSKDIGINNSPKNLVLLILVPDFLVVFAYILLFWQLLSTYYDGHASLFKSIFSDTGKYIFTTIGILLLVTQAWTVFLYLDSSIEASFFNMELVVLNFLAPSIVFIAMILIAFKFSGSPLKSALYY